MTRRALLVRLLIAAALVVGGLAACGLDEQSEPRDIAIGDVPSELLDPNPSSSTSVASTPSAVVTVYYLQLQEGATRLVGVTRSVADPLSPAARLSALLSPPTEAEQAAGITTSIPAGTRLLRTDLLSGQNVLTVDLSQSLFDVQGEELRNAFAQLVWTATDVEGVGRVQFQVDGAVYRVPDAAGVEQPGSVGRADYDSLKPVA